MLQHSKRKSDILTNNKYTYLSLSLCINIDFSLIPSFSTVYFAPFFCIFANRICGVEYISFFVHMEMIIFDIQK